MSGSPLQSQVWRSVSLIKGHQIQVLIMASDKGNRLIPWKWMTMSVSARAQRGAWVTAG